MVELGEDEEKFDQFMLPLKGAFEEVGRLLLQAETPMFQAEEAKKGLIGLARDLRGLAFAFNTKTSYMMLFDWIYPQYTNVLVRGVEIWSHDPQITTPVLKLFAELVQNRSQRLQFDVSSPNGILLFREASKIICTYGSRILSSVNNIPKEQMYPLRLKGISICFSMLKAALCGNYVNFGVFRLYGDEALDSALHTFVKLLLSIPQSDLLVYPKLSQTYYVLLECLSQDHMNFLATLEPNVFLYILSSISEGLSAIDTMVCTGCCATLDHIVTYLFKALHQKSKKTSAELENDALVRVMKHQPSILQQMLATVLNIIMFEDCRNQWSMSRPLLPLILLNNEYFHQLRQQIISQQAPDKQNAMSQWFDNLMEGIEPNLLTKNRDKFTQNLSVFRRDINESLKAPISSASSSSSSTNNSSGSVNVGGNEMITS